MATVRLVTLGLGQSYETTAHHLPSPRSYSGRASCVESFSASARSSEGLSTCALLGLAVSTSRVPVHSFGSLNSTPTTKFESLSRSQFWRPAESSDQLRTTSTARGSRAGCYSVRSFSLDPTKEAPVPNNGKTLKSLESSYYASSDTTSLKSSVNLAGAENRADNISLHNPLLRHHRLGCGWLGVILEWEGVIVDDDADLESKSWTALAVEEGRLPPPTFVLRRAEGMKNEQAIMEVLCWSRDFTQVKRLALRREELYVEMQGGTYRVLPGSREFVEAIKKYDIPIAIASTRPRNYLERAIEAVGMEGFFDVVVASEDVYRGKPDPEMFLYAADRLNFIAERCIVFGNSNSSVEAAHDAFMKCITVAGKRPVFELGAADLVVRRLNNLSVVDLKNLADLQSPEVRAPEPLPEMEPEVEVKIPTIRTADW